MSRAMIKYLRENYCLTFGEYKPRSHACIKGLEVCKLCRKEIGRWQVKQ